MTDPPAVVPPPDRIEDGPRVLVVDDQRDALKLLEVRLRSAGFKCFPFTDAMAALAFAKEEPMDVIILDVMMPQMDGYEMCRLLKSDARTRDVPVLFLTAKIAMADKVRALEAGGHDYLNKPVEQEELLARMRAALRNKQLQDRLKDQLQVQQNLSLLQQKMLGQHWQNTLGQLATSLAHEMNNPLTVAIGSVQLLLERGLPADVNERLSAVDTSLQRAAQKMRSLLLIAQPGSVAQDVDLADLIEDLIALLNYQLVAKRITLQTDLEPERLWRGAPSQLARALLYILNNGIEAVVSQPNPTVRVSVAATGTEVQLRVADNGTGISKQIQSRIFEPFFSTKGPKHNGLGLYLASEIVQNLGGKIQLQPEPGFGATEFVVQLPVRR